MLEVLSAAASQGSGLGKLVDLGLSLFGGESASDKQARLQRQFAMNGIQWKVEDAKKAGIHPLYALGAPTMSYQPSYDPGGGSDFSAASQDISRAIDATRPPEEKIDAFQTSVRQLTLQKMGLENELLASQIAKLNATQSPGIPSGAANPYLVEGQPDSGLAVPKLRGSFAGSDLVRTSPLLRMSSSSVAPGQEAGAVAEAGWLRTPTGLAPVQSKDAKDRTEEDWAATLGWNIRNRILPTFLGPSQYNPPPKSALPKGSSHWVWNPIKQEYQPSTPRRVRSNRVILKLN